MHTINNESRETHVLELLDDHERVELVEGHESVGTECSLQLDARHDGCEDTTQIQACSITNTYRTSPHVNDRQIHQAMRHLHLTKAQS
jgi:hypothetical protein